MKYVIEMGSGATMCVPSFIKIGSGVQKLTEGTRAKRMELAKP
jgi:hypothetical protein